jgi:predicted GIY-YIG superfamily endonuclease
MTSNLEARVEKHNHGFGPEYTRKHRPVVLVWSQVFSDSAAARKREKELKGWSRKKKLSLVVGLEHSEGENPKASAPGKPFAGDDTSRSG